MKNPIYGKNVKNMQKCDFFALWILVVTVHLDRHMSFDLMTSTVSPQSPHRLTGSVGVPTVDLLIFNFINVVVVFCVCDSIGRLFGVHVCLLRFRSVVLVLSVSVPVLTLWSKKNEIVNKAKKEGPDSE